MMGGDGESYLDRLRREMERSGRSQAGLAQALGIDASGVSKLMSGKRGIRARELPIIDQYLRTTCDVADPDPINVPAQGVNSALSESLLKMAQAGNDHELVTTFSNFVEDAFREFMLKKLEPNEQEKLSLPLLELVSIAVEKGFVRYPTITDFQDLIRLRNMFAHASGTLDFAQPEVKRLVLFYIGADERLIALMENQSTELVRAFFMTKAAMDLILWNTGATTESAPAIKSFLERVRGRLTRSES